MLISIVIKLVFPISLLLFENISVKQSQSSSNFCAVSSSIGLLFSFTFLCLLTSARLHEKSDFRGTGNDALFFGTQFLYSSCPLMTSILKISFYSSVSFSAKAITLPLRM